MLWFFAFVLFNELCRCSKIFSFIIWPDCLTNLLDSSVRSFNRAAPQNVTPTDKGKTHGSFSLHEGWASTAPMKLIPLLKGLINKFLLNVSHPNIRSLTEKESTINT